MVGTILVVDDDPDFVELVQALLRGRYAVDGCIDSRLALQRIREVDPILVFLDLHMPPPNGWDLLRALRDNPALASLPVLVVSAAEADAPEVEDSITGQTLGCVGVLSKPFEIDELLTKVASVLDCRSASLVAG